MAEEVLSRFDADLRSPVSSEELLDENPELEGMLRKLALQQGRPDSSALTELHALRLSLQRDPPPQQEPKQDDEQRQKQYQRLHREKENKIQHFQKQRSQREREEWMRRQRLRSGCSRGAATFFLWALAEARSLAWPIRMLLRAIERRARDILGDEAE